MIRYSKKYWGLHVLFRMYGSAFPRALPFSITSAALAGLLATFFPTSTSWDLFKHPYPFQTFAFVAGFMIVFRSNLSYGRYWEGRTQLQQMTSKLTDAVVMSLQFDRTSVPRAGATREQIEQHDWFRDTMVHLISLMHAVALATLRDDFDMENLVAHDSFAQAPPYNVRESDLEGLDCITEEPQSSSGSGGGGGGGTAATVPGSKRGGAGRHGSTGDQPKARMHAPKHAWPDKVPSLAGNRSLLDYFILRTDPEHAQHIHQAMKLPVLGGFTQAEGVALGAFTTSGEQGSAVTNLDLGIHGVILGDGTYAPAPTERVHTVLAWIQQVLIERIHDGGVKAAPPIQSRIHQVLSDSMLGYEQCKKLTETPFPFPWAQAVNIVLLVFCLTLPIIVVAFVRHPYVAATVTFIAAHTHVMLNEVARDIEDPFHYDPNELPLPQMQYKLNERLLAVSRSKRPLAFTDIGDLSGPGNTIHMQPSAAAPAQATPTQPGTIQAGPMSSPVAAVSGGSPVRTPASPPPPPAISPAPSTPPGASIAAPTASPPASPGTLASPTATEGSLDPQASGRPVPVDAGDMLEYSTANVPEAVSDAALRWRGTPGRGPKARRRQSIKRHSSIARLGSTADEGGGASSASPGVSPTPDMTMMQSAPSLRAANGSQRGSRRMASMASLNSHGSGQYSRRGDRVSMDATAMMDTTAADPVHLQVVVAANEASLRSGGAVESAARAPAAAQSIPSHKSISFGEASTTSAQHGVDAVSLNRGSKPPLQADPGSTPFNSGDGAEASAGQKATPSADTLPRPNEVHADNAQYVPVLPARSRYRETLV